MLLPVSRRLQRVRVYTWNGAAWIQRGADVLGDVGGGDFGDSVALNFDGTVLAIGAPRGALPDGSGGWVNLEGDGHLRIFGWEGSSWAQHGVDIDVEGAGSFWGYSVSLNADGSVVAIGAPWGGDSFEGLVRVFRWDGISWTQIGADIDGELV